MLTSESPYAGLVASKVTSTQVSGGPANRPTNHNALSVQESSCNSLRLTSDLKPHNSDHATISSDTATQQHSSGHTAGPPHQRRRDKRPKQPRTPVPGRASGSPHFSRPPRVQIGGIGGIEASCANTGSARLPCIQMAAEWGQTNLAESSQSPSAARARRHTYRDDRR